MLDIDPATFRRGLFNLRTRRFGTAAELLIQKLLNASKGRTQFHDLYDDERNHRIEVKFSTVNAASTAPINLKNLISSIMDAGTERAVSYSDWEKFKFDCNIQQVKSVEFEILYYGLFFCDVIIIFRMETDCLLSDKSIQFSDKQHKGNIGEGQFHINNATFRHHLKNYHYKTITYPEFIEIITS